MDGDARPAQVAIQRTPGEPPASVPGRAEAAPPERPYAEDARRFVRTLAPPRELLRQPGALCAALALHDGLGMRTELSHQGPQIDPTLSVAELVQSIPGAARTFEKLGIDYCCRGKQSLRDAAAHSSLPLDALIERLLCADEAPVVVPSDAGELCAHIVRHHHAYTREALERLAPLADKVVRVHGAMHPELRRVRELLDLLAQDLIPHMLKEERVLFPYVASLAAGAPPSAPFGRIENPLRVMHFEHDHVGELLRALSVLTDGYRPPVGACASYGALYAGLEDLQADLHEHIHLENNVLFPAAITLQQRLVQP